MIKVNILPDAYVQYEAETGFIDKRDLVSLSGQFVTMKWMLLFDNGRRCSTYSLSHCKITAER